MQTGSYNAAAPTALPLLIFPAPQPSLLAVVRQNKIEPFHQGKLDGLCGLYAPIKALRLVRLGHAPLSRLQCKQLFADGTHFLNRRGKFGEIATEGMGLRRSYSLACHLAKKASTEKFAFQIERPQHQLWGSINDVFEWIEASLVLHQPVLIPLANSLDHYSVVVGTTAKALHLFDSSGVSFVRKSNCGLRKGIHHIPPSGLLRFTVRPSG